MASFSQITWHYKVRKGDNGDQGRRWRAVEVGESVRKRDYDICDSEIQNYPNLLIVAHSRTSFASLNHAVISLRGVTGLLPKNCNFSLLLLFYMFNNLLYRLKHYLKAIQ